MSVCHNVLCESRTPIRTAAQLLGLMISSFPGVMYGPLHYRRLNMEKTRALGHFRDFDGTMEISFLAHEDI